MNEPAGSPFERSGDRLRWSALAFLAALAAALAFLAIGAPASRAAFPGQDGKIFFVSDRDGNDEIYSMNSDGTDQRRLTYTSLNEAEPSASPNGRWVVYQSFAEGFVGLRIEIMRQDGSSNQILTGGPGAPSLDPSFTPDGQGILFTRVNSEGWGEIWSLELATGIATRITEHGITPQRAPENPEMLPDGSAIVYGGEDGAGGPRRIFSFPPSDPYSQQMVSQMAGLEDRRPTVSPDSQSVLYSDYLDSTSMALVKTDLASLFAEALLLSGPSVFFTASSYSPSGTKIAYQASTPADTYPDQIHVKEVNTFGEGPVITGPGSNNSRPNWSPRAKTPRFGAVRKPRARTSSRTAKFRFRALTPGTRLDCRLDRERVRACPLNRTLTFRGLRRGVHRLRVAPYLIDETALAIGQYARVDGRAVTYRWRVR